jgi:hypothetical protein
MNKHSPPRGRLQPIIRTGTLGEDKSKTIDREEVKDKNKNLSRQSAAFSVNSS